MIILLFAVIMFVLVVWSLLAPLVQARRRPPDPPLNGHLPDLEEQRESALAAIREVDFDYRLGKISEEDYQELRNRYEHQTISVMRAIDARDGAIEEDIERRVRRLVEIGPGGTAHDLPAACPTCGGPLRRLDRFCPACGGAAPSERPRLDDLRRLPEHTPESAGGHAPRAMRWGLIGAGVLVLFLGGVATLYFTTRPSPDGAAPSGRVSARSYDSLAFAGGAPALILAHPGGLLRSADAGTTWDAVPGVEGAFTAVAATRTPSPLLLAAGPNGLWRSLDDGMSWSAWHSDLPAETIRALAVDPADGRRWYALSGPGLYTSTDGAQTWTLAATGLPEGASSLAATPNTLYLGTPDLGVAATRDNGRTWANANGFGTGLLAGRNVRALAVDAGSGSLYAATEAGLSRSDDGGATWVPTTLQAAAVAVAVEMREPRHVVAIDSSGAVYISADRGVRWGGK